MVVIPLRLQDAMKGDLAALNEIPRIESGDTLVVP
jgi:hypothetical protein